MVLRELEFFQRENLHNTVFIFQLMFFLLLFLITTSCSERVDNSIAYKVCDEDVEVSEELSDYEQQSSELINDSNSYKCVVDRNSCDYEGDRKCSEQGVFLCSFDEYGCGYWRKIKDCFENEECEGPGLCLSEDPVLSVKKLESKNGTVTVVLSLSQPVEYLLPRIADLEIVVKNLRYIQGSETKGDAVLDANKEINVSGISNDKLRVVIHGFNSERIKSGILATLKFKRTENGPHILYIEKKEEMFSPPAADMNLTIGGYFCIPNCIDRACGSDGCGGSCGECVEQ